jgi:hypothetical protein
MERKSGADIGGAGGDVGQAAAARGAGGIEAVASVDRAMMMWRASP